MALVLAPQHGLPMETMDHPEYLANTIPDPHSTANDPPTYRESAEMPAYNPLGYDQKESLPERGQSFDDDSLYGATPDALDVPPPLPPRSPRRSTDGISPLQYSRDPKRLTAYLIPFPKPLNTSSDSETQYPSRFLIYTPPPPPLSKPKEGEKEAKTRKVQRKWQEEVRAAKTSQAKTRSWKGVRAGATKGISNLMGKTTNSSIDFLGRVNTDPASDAKSDDDKAAASKTSALEEMTLLYPPSVSSSPDTLRAEFIDSMVRTKSKAQRDAIIATGLLPVAEAIDILATPVWPFGGLMEIDAVWAYGNIRGAKTARTVTKRLANSGAANSQEEQLRLNFMPEFRLEVLERYLQAKCHQRDPRRFPAGAIAPTETEVLAAIGWNPSQVDSETRSWEDEQWELSEVKEDLRNVMEKGAKEWINWCKAFDKDPEKAIKK